MTTAERYLSQLEEFLVGKPDSQGNWRAYCPLHEDPETSKTPSASINFQDGVWKCFGHCGGGAVSTLMKKIRAGGEAGKASYDPFENITSLDDHRAKKSGEKREPISEAKIKEYYDDLKDSGAELSWLIRERCLKESTIDKFQIGWDKYRNRYTIPIRDADGNLVNIRRYKPNAAKSEKLRNAIGHGSPPRLFPIENLDGEEILVCEGELDALLAAQHGFKAVTGTHGVATWEPSWSHLFKDKVVYIVFDCDKEGRIGAKKAAKSLSKYARSVHIVELPLTPDSGEDVTDWFKQGHTAEELRSLVSHTEPWSDAKSPGPADVPALPVPVQVIGSMDSTTNGKSLTMQVTITGRRDPTYSVPRRALLECTLDAGAKCKLCPMAAEWEGEHEVVIEATDIAALSRFVDVNEDKKLELLRKHVGAAKCTRLSWEALENQTIEEIFVTGSIDKESHEEADYTQRRIYNVGSHETKTNTTAKVVGTTTPNPKDSRNEFFSWALEESVTSIDRFDVTADVRSRLSIFQPKEGQRPLEKCREIAEDLSANVTKIIGRERLHIAMDLVWHSILHFPLDDKMISRGWLEFIVVGDTRTGKSETAIRLTDHYGLGHVIGCEGATFAGLVGGVKQLGDAWTVTWGELTLNDRRLAVLDEASGLSQELIGQMSDIRSRGMAQLTKIESQQTRARCRLIWISNPRKSKFVDEKKIDGIDIIEDLIGNPEDIARFDFAMSVSMKDVDLKQINSPDRPQVPHRYTSELCRELVLWAWSRKPDQVEWKPDAYRHVYTSAGWMAKRFVDHPPLVQGTNVREKIARLAVALAARTYSTDDTGERVIVCKEHVEDATKFLYELYAYDNFGYLRMSNRIHRNRKIAKENREAIRKWLRSNKRLLEFLLDRRGSFRSQDLEEMAHMERDEVNHILGKLSDAKMISKNKSQIIVEPELHALLKEMEE